MNTPRTDVAEQRLVHMTNSEQFIGMVARDDMDQLETELLSSQARLLALREAIPPTLNRAFVRGWMRGHEHTVEGTFIPILPQDEATFFKDDIDDLSRDGSLPELQEALTQPAPPVVSLAEFNKLAEYAQHQDWCTIFNAKPGDIYTCSCGLKELLTPTK